MSVTTNRFPRLRRHEIVRQFVKYALVGAMNVAMFLAIFNFMLMLGVHTLGANAVGFVLTSFNSFTLNKIWTFRDRRRDAVARQYLIFVLFTLVGLALNSGALTLLLVPLERYGTIGKNAAALLALPVSVIWNFNAYRRWIFRHGGHAADG